MKKSQDKFTPENEEWKCHYYHNRTALDPREYFIRDKATGDEIAVLRHCLQNRGRDLQATGNFIARAPALLTENRLMKEEMVRLEEENLRLREVVKKAVDYLEYESKFQGIGKRRGEMLATLKEALKKEE